MAIKPIYHVLHDNEVKHRFTNLRTAISFVCSKVDSTNRLWRTIRYWDVVRAIENDGKFSFKGYHIERYEAFTDISDIK